MFFGLLSPRRSALAWGAGTTPIGAAPSSMVAYGSNDAFGGAPSTVQTQMMILSPFNGILRNLFVIVSAVMGAGITVQYTVYVNEVATAILCQIAGAAQLQSSDLVNSVTVVQGDRIEIAGSRIVGVPPTVIQRATLELSAT